DSFDLYAARARAAFVHQAAKELQVPEGRLKKDLGQVLLKLEELQEAQIRAATSPADEESAPEMTSEEEAAALELLRSPRLLDRILEDFRRCGVVGEETNKLVGYLAAVSRKLHAPLAVIIQSSSAAGKTSLMEAVLAFMPEEERVQYSAMTGQSLFYMGETDLAHKILAIVEEEGAERASYALKLLQSEGELTIASTGKNPRSGRLETQEYRVEGPVMILLTTTAIDLDEELLNRCLVLSVDEGREQTRAIHRLQRERRTLDGLFAQENRSDVRRVHRNAQRMLRPLPVVNPWAPALTFVDDRTRTRRDHEKYLTLIDTIALLHQFQREVRSAERDGRVVEYVEVELGDLEIANRLAADVLGRSLDELPPQTRRFLQRLDVWVAEQCEELAMDRTEFRFTAREVRLALGTGPTQTWTHLNRLAELEYLVAHRGGRGQISVYELIYYGVEDDRDVFLPGLLDVDKLRKHSTTSENLSGSGGPISGESADLSAPIRPHFGANSDPAKRRDRGDSNGSGRESSVSPGITTRRDTKNRNSGRTVVESAAS
ncbi:MAG: DNA primase, partial [Thermoanaerobaculia bacterium]|nr:DNA primase [Thermoanaerobaculia bacterium]